MEKKNVILEKSLEFALSVIEYSEMLDENKKFVIARQLIRSGTSIGANIREAQSCKSRADFIHKLKIAAKEAQETEYWLILCNRSKNFLKTNFYLLNWKKYKNFYQVSFLLQNETPINPLAY